MFMRLVAFRKRIIIAKKREENRCIIIQVTSVENNLNESERNWNMPKKHVLEKRTYMIYFVPFFAC